MKGSDVLGRVVAPGALAGLSGGAVFGVAMSQLGVLPTIASLVRADSTVIGLVVHMVIAAIIGVGFAVLVLQQRWGLGEMLFWGLTYGLFWWYLGALTLLPLFLGRPVDWALGSAQQQFPSLVGHLLYGATTGLAFGLFQRDGARAAAAPSSSAVLLRGGVAGIAASVLLGAALSSQNQLLAGYTMMTGASGLITWIGTLLIGGLSGLGYAALYPRPPRNSGTTLIRGMTYGFLWWILGALTILPLIDGAGLTWTIAAARSGFVTLPGYLLFGSGTALLYQWLSAIVRLLFSDNTRRYDEEGAGTVGLRTVARGGLAGLLGGLLFTLVMLQLGFLSTVAALVGSSSSTTGLFVHLLIANLIGASYGLLFRRQSYDITSGLGWGVAYGFFWWVLGALTLLPVLLGGSPQWTAAEAASSFPSLVGHLAYGAGLGIVFYRLEARHNPWWISRTQADQARARQLKEQLQSSAPALWALVVVIALTIPMILGR